MSLEARQTAINSAHSIIDDMLVGNRNSVEAAKYIFWNALDEYNFEAETKKYVYDSIGLERAYGLVDRENGIIITFFGWGGALTRAKRRLGRRSVRIKHRYIERL